MSTIPLSRLKKGAVVHIDSIAPNPVFGDLDTLVTRRLSDLGFSSGMPLQVIAVGGLKTVLCFMIYARLGCCLHYYQISGWIGNA